jgi:drug/metabolite transporter (DMT)-like permease
MSLQAILLLLVSAFIHASWNFLSKRNHASLSFFLVAVFSSVVFFSPIGWHYRDWLSQIPTSIWGLLILTAGFQAMYYFGLAGAYRRGELSVVYPLVRALPVLTVAAMSGAMGRAEQITMLGLSGMILVAAGCLILPMRKFSIHMQPFSTNPALWLATLAAVGTTGYTLVDDTALRILRDLPGLGVQGIIPITLLYTLLEGVSILVWLAFLVSVIPAERREIAKLSRITWAQAGLAGVFMLLAYGLVLIAMAFVRDVSYVAAFRQTSIPIGALIGLALEKEKPYAPKIAGILSISAGLALVAIG